MDNRLYELMNWPRIEALVYSEEDEPQEILGPHKTEEGILVQAFLPTAVKMTAVIRGTGKEYEMELADEGGFFAVLLPGKTVPEYFFRTPTGSSRRCIRRRIWTNSRRASTIPCMRRWEPIP